MSIMIRRIGISAVLAATFLSGAAAGAQAATRGMADRVQGVQAEPGAVQIPMALVVAAAVAVLAVTIWAADRRRRIFA